MLEGPESPPKCAVLASTEKHGIGSDKICTFKSAIYMVRDLLINSPVRQPKCTWRAHLTIAWVRTQRDCSNAVFTMDHFHREFLLETFHKKSLSSAMVQFIVGLLRGNGQEDMI